MSAWERRLQYVANLLVGGTGVVYAIMRYLMQPTDEWAVVNHPWQPHVQHLHVLTAPLLVFVCGLVWHRHVKSNWANGERSLFTGLGLVLMLVPMIASGYLIQTTVSDGWRQAWVFVHLVASGAWLFSFLGHLAWPLWQRMRGIVAPVSPAADVRTTDDLEPEPGLHVVDTGLETA